jgi:hypothetical protein
MGVISLYKYLLQISAIGKKGKSQSHSLTRPGAKAWRELGSHKPLCVHTVCSKYIMGRSKTIGYVSGLLLKDLYWRP